MSSDPGDGPRPDDAGSDPPRSGRGRALLRSLSGVGLVGGAIWWLGPSWSELARMLEFHLGFALVALGCSTVALLVTAARWKALSESWGNEPLPLGFYVHHLAWTRFAGQLTSVLVMDLVGRSAALRSAGSSRGLTDAVTPLVVERALDVVFPVVMLGWAWAVLQTQLPALPSFIVVTAAAAVAGALSLPALVDLGVGSLRLLARIRRRDFVSTDVRIGTGLAWRVTGWSTLRYLSVAAQYWAMGAAAGVSLRPFVILAATPVAALTGMIGITPGGLGIQEAGWSGALLLLDQSPAAVVVFVLAARAGMIANFGILSLVTRPLRGRRSEEARS